MEIRQGTEADYAAAMELVAEFAEESLSEYGIYLEPEKLKRTFDLGYKTGFGLFIEGKLVGVLGGHIIEDFCSKMPIYEELIWFVTKKYRKYGMLLFRYVENWCRQQNIKRMSMVCMHNSKTAQLFSLYKRMGFKPMETRFIKELD